MAAKTVSLMSTALLLAASYLAQGQDRAQAEASMPQVECNDALYRFLPGDVNYCLAIKMWGQGRYRQGEEFLLLAASWGSKSAQYALGIAYWNGDGVSKNRPLGLAWLSLSAERGESTYKAVMNSAYADSSAEERQSANVLHAELAKTYQDDVAAARAKNRFDREFRAVASNKAYMPKICITGLNSGSTESAADPSFCPRLDPLLDTLSDVSEEYFKGWKARVDVGQLMKVEDDALPAEKRPPELIRP